MTTKILVGDCRSVLRTLPERSVHCCVTSPPYFGLRDYGVAGQIGLEPTPDAFVAEMVAVFREVRRVLRDDGTLWLNLGDSYFSSNGPTAGGASPKSTLTGGGGKYRAGSKMEAMYDQSVGGGCKAEAGAKSISLPLRNRPGIQLLKPKDLIGIPWRVAFALQADGWWLRSSIIWHKPNPMPESVRDRPTSAHENIFLLAKSDRYFFDAEAVKEAATEQVTGQVDGRRGDGGAYKFKPTAQATHFGTPETGRNIRNVWTVATQPFSDAHFATFPPALIEPCIKAGCPAGGTVLDPFGGAGTTGLVADRLQRDAILIELNPTYAEMAGRRISAESGMFSHVEVRTAQIDEGAAA